LENSFVGYSHQTIAGNSDSGQIKAHSEAIQIPN